MTARKQIIYWGKKALLFVISVLVLSLAGELDVLLLGEETARSLGLPARRLRLLLLTLAAALAGLLN